MELNEELVELNEEDVHIMDNYTITDCPNNPYVLGIIEGSFMGPLNEDNGNGRTYLEDTITEGIINLPYTKRMIDNKSLLGEAHHPLERTSIWMDESAISTRKLWLSEDKKYLMGRADILDTPKGRIVNTLARYGTKIGVSARANGKGVKRNGKLEIRKENYKFKTFDVVLNPGFVESRPTKYESDGNPMQCFEEQKDKMSDALYEEIESQVKQKICDNKMLQYYIDYSDDERLKGLIPLTEDSQEEDMGLVEELQDKVKLLEEENGSLKVKLNNIEADYSSLEEELNESIKIRDERIKFIESDNKILNESADDQIDSLLNEINDLRNQIVGLNEEREDLQLKVSELNSRILSAEDYRSDSERENTLLESQVEELVEEATQLKSQNKALDEEVQSLLEEQVSTETTQSSGINEEKTSEELEKEKHDVHMRNLSKVVEKFRNPVVATSLNEELQDITKTRKENMARVSSLVSLVGGRNNG